MKVAIVHSFYSEAVPSGENSVVLDQYAQLCRAGYDVELISRHTDLERGHRGYSARSALTTLTGHGASPEQQLARFDPDIVHLHNTFPNFGTKWLDTWGSKTVATLHNYRSLCSNGLLFRDGAPCNECLAVSPVIPAVRHRCYRGSRLATLPVALASAPRGMLRRVLDAASRLVVLNESSREIYAPLHAHKVELVPNFVAAQESRTHVEGWAFVGRLSSEKGILDLLESWPPGERLDIIGDGPQARAVDRIAQRNPSVRVLGLIDRTELLTSLGGYRGLILPSQCREGLPTVVLEALACGVPSILSSHVEAGAELQEHGAATVYDPSEGTSAVEQALSIVRRDHSEMTSAARAVHRARYSPTAWQAEMDRIYESVAR